MIGVFGVDIRLEELLKVETELMEEHGVEFTETDIRALTKNTGINKLLFLVTRLCLVTRISGLCPDSVWKQS